MKVICIECNRSVPEGICCDYCGAPLACVADVENAESASTLDAVPVEMSALDMPPVDMVEKSVIPERVALKEGVSTEFSSADIELSYHNAEFSVVGLDDTFNIILKAGEKKLTNICVYAEHQSYDGPRVVGKTKELWHLRAGHSRKLSIAYKPRREGVAVYCLYIVYKREGELCCLESDERRIEVYPPGARAKDAIHNLSINIKNEIRDNHGHANDYGASNTLDGLDRLIKTVAPSDDIKSMIKEIAKCGSYIQLELYNSNWHPVKTDSAEMEVVVPLRLCGAPAEGESALTLLFAGNRVHIFEVDGSFSIGRTRDNQIVTRHIAHNGCVNMEANKKISRRHCLIEQSGDEICVLDNSSWGTFLDGHAVHGSAVLKKQQNSFVLSLAGEDSNAFSAFALRCQLWTCGHAMQKECRLAGCAGKRETSSIILQRMDAHKESHVGLWHCCDMQSVDSALAGLVVWRQDGGFGYATATESGWLHPGLTLMVGGKPVEVLEHSPLGCS